MTSRNSIFGLTLTSLLALAILPANADVYSSYKDGAYGAAFNWTGFYVGVNGGYAFDDVANHGGMEDNGGFGGGQIGYNWQGAFGISRMLVLGFESDFEGTDIFNSGRGILRWASGLTHDDLHKRAIPYFGTVRGRIGLSLNGRYSILPAALPTATKEIHFSIYPIKISIKLTELKQVTCLAAVSNIRLLRPGL